MRERMELCLLAFHGMPRAARAAAAAAVLAMFASGEGGGEGEGAGAGGAVYKLHTVVP